MPSYEIYGDKIEGDDKPIGIVFNKRNGKITGLSQQMIDIGFVTDSSIVKIEIQSKDYNDADTIIFNDLEYPDFKKKLLDMIENIKGDPEKSITFTTNQFGGLKYKRTRRNKRRRTIRTRRTRRTRRKRRTRRTRRTGRTGRMRRKRRTRK
jgi:hypothetical protein